MKTLSIFGATGSVGESAFDLLTSSGGPEAWRTVAVTGGRNVARLAQMARALRAEVAVAESGIVQRLSPEDVVRGVATRSYVAVMDDAGRDEFLAGIRALLADHPDTRGRAELELPYRTHAYRLTPR